MTQRCHDHVFFFFNDPATTELYTLSLHDALPICPVLEPVLEPDWEPVLELGGECFVTGVMYPHIRSEEHTSELSHITISYDVFCLKKNKKKKQKTAYHNHKPTNIYAKKKDTYTSNLYQLLKNRQHIR